MIAKNTDIKNWPTGLTPDEARAAREECQRMKQRQALGSKYLCHPANAPKRSTYNPITGARMS